MKTPTVEHAIWINSQPEQVWQALTQPEQIMPWFVPNLPFFTMTRDENGSLTIQMGETGVPLMRFEHLEPPSQVTIRTLPDDLISCTYTLDAANNGTNLKISANGFERLPEAGREDRTQKSRAAWLQTLQNLKAHLEGAALPFPNAYVAPLFGYWHESKETFSLERSIWIKASLEQVWQAVTDPAQIEGWFSPGTPWQLTALKVGGRLFAPDADTGAEKHTQIIETLEPPYRFVLRTPTDAEGKSEMTTYSLLAEAKGTRLTITHAGYEHKGEISRWGAMEQNTFGFGMVLQNTKAYVEGDRLPFPGGF
jgi:uncharacterized protein YndB with AHSA1/START domain